LIDKRYTIGHPARFAFVSRFFKDAQYGELPSVSFIDPNFVDMGDHGDAQGHDGYTIFPTEASDHHPPTDVRHAQQMILEIYAGLVSSRLWEKTFLVITYDEAGGFYDHVPPPPVDPEAVDGPGFEFDGVRVPALVISPWVRRQAVSSTLFDHTSVIKTILVSLDLLK